LLPPRRRRRLPHDLRVELLAIAAALPGLILGLALLFKSDFAPRTQWTLAGLVVLATVVFATAAREAVARPLQTLSNLLGALREEDFSFRARVGRRDDPLGQALIEVNALAQTLREQRLGALEATALLRKVMEEIDVAVFAFDASLTLQLLNRAGERLLGAPAERLVEKTAEAVGLAALLVGEPTRIVDASFPGATGRFDVRRTSFRQRGKPMQLLVLADVSRALRDEERQAWQRLIRVIGHELNNSLAPIRSVAGSLETLLVREPRPEDWQGDMRRGLGVIAARAESLRRFMDAYAQLARLPASRRRDRPARDARGRHRDAAAGEGRRRTFGDGGGRSRSARAAPDQPREERRRCGGGHAGRRARFVDGLRQANARLGHPRGRRRARPAAERQPVRAVLHDQARRLRHRPRALPADRRGARRHALAREPAGGRLPRDAAPAAIGREP
jgi:PAS domain-containing protein